MPVKTSRKLLILGALGAVVYLITNKAPDVVKKIISSAGLPTTDKTLPRGLRNNNPLNLRKGVNWAGRAGDDGAFDIFKTMSDGMRAGARNFYTAVTKHKADTISKLVARWAPASDGNNVQAYVDAVSKAAGVGANVLINPTDRVVAAKILRAMAIHENGAQHDAKVPIVQEWVKSTYAYG